MSLYYISINYQTRTRHINPNIRNSTRGLWRSEASRILANARRRAGGPRRAASLARSRRSGCLRRGVGRRRPLLRACPVRGDLARSTALLNGMRMIGYRRNRSFFFLLTAHRQLSLDRIEERTKRAFQASKEERVCYAGAFLHSSTLLLVSYRLLPRTQPLPCDPGEFCLLRSVIGWSRSGVTRARKDQNGQPVYTVLAYPAII